MERRNEGALSPIRYAALLLCALLAAGGYRFTHASIWSGEYFFMPGLGFAASHWLLMGVALLLGREGLRRRGEGIALLALSLLLSACYGLYGDDWLRLMNFPVLIALSAQALYALRGQNAGDALSGAGLWEGFRRFFGSLFRYVLDPFRQARQLKKAGAGRVGPLLLGLALGLPVLLLIGALLMQADAVFGSLLSGVAEEIRRVDGAALWNLALTLAGGLILFSLLYSALLPPRTYAAPAGRTVSPALWAAPLALLGALYALFVYVQVRYLFAGAESAAMAGGHAQYARSGFFQMTAAAFITLGLILPALSLCRESRLVRGLCAAVSLLTLAVIFSAFWRMRLYILAYGMSLLRALTLWAMAVFAAAFVLALVKCARPGFRLCPVLAALALGTWVALNLSNVDFWIARYNVTAYNAGALERLDTEYLINLSPDTRPALERIKDPIQREDALREADALWQKRTPNWYDGSLSWLRLPKAE